MKLELISLAAYVGSLFVLYRMLVKNYERQVNILKDEITFKHGYKSKLEEIKLFYEEEVKILQKKLSSSETNQKEIKREIEELEVNKAEIETELRKGIYERTRIEDILRRSQGKYKNQEQILRDENESLIEEVTMLKDQYRSLVQYAKDNFGEYSLLDFHYGDEPYKQLKSRRGKHEGIKYRSK